MWARTLRQATSTTRRASLFAPRSLMFAQTPNSERSLFVPHRVERASFATEGTTETSAAEESTKKRSRYDYWKLGFIDLIRNPQNHKDLFYDPADADLSTRNVAVVYDRKPKARVHFMIIPTILLQTYKNLNETHIELLEEMRDRANQLVEELKQTDKGKNLNYKIGFQAVPSMLQIHLHVISDDFDSPHVKNKRHWNTFNTDFFLSPEVLIEQLKTQGCVDLDEAHYNEVIKQPLACPHCGQEIKRLPDLMVHIEEVHKQNV